MIRSICTQPFPIFPLQRCPRFIVGSSQPGKIHQEQAGGQNILESNGLHLCAPKAITLRPTSLERRSTSLRAMSVSDANQQKIDSESRKRRRISVASSGNHDESDADVLEISSADWTSATRKKVASSKDCGRSTKPISPPSSRKAGKETKTSWKTSGSGSIETLPDDPAPRNPCSRASPIQLSTVSGLPASSNIDTLSLGDILGDPLIKECWLFNYLFDVDFIMYISLFQASCIASLIERQVPIG